MTSGDAWEQVAQDEAQALASLLATEGRRVLVVVVGVEDAQDGLTRFTHAVAGQTEGRHLFQFIAALERKLNWLRQKTRRTT